MLKKFAVAGTGQRTRRGGNAINNVVKLYKYALDSEYNPISINGKIQYGRDDLFFKKCKTKPFLFYTFSKDDLTGDIVLTVLQGRRNTLCYDE